MKRFTPLKLSVAISFFAALAFVALAKEADPVTHDFLAPNAVDYQAVLTPPPAEDSIPAQGEHELAVELDAHRTPEQAAFAKSYEKLDVFKLLAPVLGDWCTAENLPRTAALFRQARAESRPVVEAAKAGWNRSRPYNFNPALTPAVEKPHNTSYPSGHGYDSALYAVLLTAALPDHAADWQKQAALVRWSRLVGGAHYPSDVVAGKILGEAVGREMLKSPKLQQALDEVRAELAARLHRKAA